MTLQSALARSVRVLVEREDEDDNARFIDLEVSLRVADVEVVDGETRWKPGTDDEIISVGGRWDRSRKLWTEGACKRVLVIRVHRGQEDAARWLGAWFRGRITGDWTGFRRVWWALFCGGRRGGKSHLACVALVLYAVAFPAALTWAISPTQEETDELEHAFRALLPRAWYKFRGAGSGKVSSFRLPHSSRIMLLSGHKPRGLKRGRVDLALYNEGQNQHRAGFVQLRGAIADRGGLIIVAANPPDAPIGRWVEDFYDGAVSGKLDGVAWDFNPERNPWVTYAALASMRDEVDEKTYRREILGEFVPIGDVVFYSWSDRANWIDVPRAFVDITAEFTRGHFGKSYGYIVGMDFQRTPHMAAAIFKVFRDPADATGDPLLWVVDECIIPQTDEAGLLDALESKERWTQAGWVDGGYRGQALEGDRRDEPTHCVVVMDASGWTQDGDHHKGKTSELALRARRWTALHRPQVDSNRNPDLVERMKAGNARLRSASGLRRLFVAKHCLQTAEAMRRWENKHGVPYRQSVYAHACDAVTYPVFRFFGRPRRVGSGSVYRSVNRMSRRDQMRGI